MQKNDSISIWLDFTKAEKSSICKHLKMLSTKSGFKSGYMHIYSDLVRGTFRFVFYIKEEIYSKITKKTEYIEHVKYIEKIYDGKLFSDIKYFGITISDHNISNLYNFLRVSTGNRLRFNVWFNNNCDLFTEKGLINQELIISDDMNYETALHMGLCRESNPFCRNITMLSDEIEVGSNWEKIEITEPTKAEKTFISEPNSILFND